MHIKDNSIALKLSFNFWQRIIPFTKMNVGQYITAKGPNFLYIICCKSILAKSEVPDIYRAAMLVTEILKFIRELGNEIPSLNKLLI